MTINSVDWGLHCLLIQVTSCAGSSVRFESFTADRSRVRLTVNNPRRGLFSKRDRPRESSYFATHADAAPFASRRDTFYRDTFSRVFRVIAGALLLTDTRRD